MDSRDTILHFPVEGMTCAGCASTVEKGLEKVPGVDHASVNFGTREARVEGSPEGGFPALVTRVRELGYEVGVESRRYLVEGMHCASCVAKVEREVSLIPGVTSASVNLAAGEVQVTSVAGLVDESAVDDVVVDDAVQGEVVGLLGVLS